MGALTGQVAMVTGCGRLMGAGRAIASALAAAGADVVVTDIEPGGTRNLGESGADEIAAGWQGLPSLVAELTALGARALAVTGDVAVPADAAAMVKAAVDAFGAVDILVNNAASPQGNDRVESWLVPLERFDEIWRVNARGTFIMSTEVIRHLLSRSAPGRIININSAAGRRGGARHSAYSASKFAIIGLTQAMATELIETGITVNALCMGGLDTARQRREGAVAGAKPPVGRMGTGADVARGVMFLADPAADFITGESIMITGGQAIY